MTPQEKELKRKRAEVEALEKQIEKEKEEQKNQKSFDELMSKIDAVTERLNKEYSDMLLNHYGITWEQFLITRIIKLQEDVDHRAYWDYVNSR